MHIKERTASLLSAALKLSERDGWHSLTHASIAAAADCSPSLVKVRLGTIESIRRAVMRVAVKQRMPRTVAEGLLAGDRVARKADRDLRAECSALVYSA